MTAKVYCLCYLVGTKADIHMVCSECSVMISCVTTVVSVSTGLDSTLRMSQIWTTSCSSPCWASWSSRAPEWPVRERWEEEEAVVWPATDTTSAGITALTSPQLREISGQYQENYFDEKIVKIFYLSSISPGYLIFKKCSDPPADCDCGQDKRTTTSPPPPPPPPTTTTTRGLIIKNSFNFFLHHPQK